MPAAGADFVASKLNAIAANPDVFAKTVFVLIYDENDGLLRPRYPAHRAGGHARRVHHRVGNRREGCTRPDRPGLPGAVHHRLALDGGRLRQPRHLRPHLGHPAARDGDRGREPEHHAVAAADRRRPHQCPRRHPEPEIPAAAGTKAQLEAAENEVTEFQLPPIPGANQTFPVQPPGSKPGAERGRQRGRSVIRMSLRDSSGAGSAGPSAARWCGVSGRDPRGRDRGRAGRRSAASPPSTRATAGQVRPPGRVDVQRPGRRRLRRPPGLPGLRCHRHGQLRHHPDLQRGRPAGARRPGRLQLRLDRRGRRHPRRHAVLRRHRGGRGGGHRRRHAQPEELQPGRDRHPRGFQPR